MSLRRRKLKCLSRATNIDKGYLCTSGAGSAYPSGSPDFTPCFSGIRFTRSLVLCVCFVDHCLSFWPLCCLLGFTDSDYLFGIFKLFFYG